MLQNSVSGEVKDSVIVLFYGFFMSFMCLYLPLVLPLAHPHELNMECDLKFKP